MKARAAIVLACWLVGCGSDVDTDAAAAAASGTTGSSSSSSAGTTATTSASSSTSSGGETCAPDGFCNDPTATHGIQRYTCPENPDPANCIAELAEDGGTIEGSWCCD